MIRLGGKDMNHGKARRLLFVAVATPVALAAASLPAQADQTYYVPVSKSWTIHGHGYGHGHGLSQYGAEGAALQGLDYTKIINFYYPGTQWAQAKGKVRVLITADWSSDVQVRPRPGLVVKDLQDGASWTLPAKDGIDRWRLTPAKGGATAVQFHNAHGWHRWRIPGPRATFTSDGQFQAPGPLTLLVPSGGDVVGRQYRGALRSVRPYAGAKVRDTVNVVTLDGYVKGVVPYEMPASWHGQALRSQAVAARTYGVWMRAQNPTRYYQICDTTSCQVYGGVGAEQKSSNEAVRGTARKILKYDGKPAFTQFSASSGGWTSDGNLPYLPAKKDPYDNFSGNPVHDWSVTVSTTSLENAHPSIGKLIDLRVTSREGNGEWGGRVKQIVLDGSTGKAYMTGDDLRWHYGLRSAWFSIEPTPIMMRWHRMGGPKSGLGRPASGEFGVSTGAAQNFNHGRMFWTSHTGARDVRGPSLKTYTKWGGPRSKLGWPKSGMMNAQGRGHKVKFQGGYIFSKPRTGAHVLYGAILERWSRAGAAGSWMGYPVTSVQKTRAGQRAKFRHAVIKWDRSSGKTRVVKR